MLLAALSFAFAADIVPGSHVLVKKGAPLARPGGGWSEVPAVTDVAWPAEVLADEGDTLRVRIAADGCVPRLWAGRYLDVVFTVREADLQPLVVSSVRGVEKAGEAWYVGAGAPVTGQSGGVQVDAGSGLTVTMPDTVPVGLATPLPSAQPPIDGEPRLTSRSAGHLGSFRGVPVAATRDWVEVRKQDGRLAYAGRCVAFTFDGTGQGGELHPPTAGFGGLIGTKARLRTGTPLFWPDGAAAGQLRDGYTPEATEARDALTCFTMPLTSSDTGTAPGVPLCVQTDTVRPPEPATAGDAIVLGALDKSLIDAVIKRNMSQIRYCYQRSLTDHPTLAGRVVVKFVVAKDGTVSSAVTKETTLNDANVEACINGRFLRFQFPEPKGGGIVIVSYPFEFRPGS